MVLRSVVWLGNKFLTILSDLDGIEVRSISYDLNLRLFFF